MKKIVEFLLASHIPFAYSNHKPAVDPAEHEFSISVPYLDEEKRKEIVEIIEQEDLTVAVKGSFGYVISDPNDVVIQEEEEEDPAPRRKPAVKKPAVKKPAKKKGAK